jgi:hypothetical protein
MGDRIVLAGDHRGVPLKRELALAEPIAAACGAGAFDAEAARARVAELCRSVPLYPGRGSDAD